MAEVGNVVQTPDGAIGSIVEWTDHGMRPGTFTIEWDETTYTGASPVRYWTREASSILTVLS